MNDSLATVQKFLLGQELFDALWAKEGVNVTDTLQTLAKQRIEDFQKEVLGLCLEDVYERNLSDPQLKYVRSLLLGSYEIASNYHSGRVASCVNKTQVLMVATYINSLARRL